MSHTHYIRNNVAEILITPPIISRTHRQVIRYLSSYASGVISTSQDTSNTYSIEEALWLENSLRKRSLAQTIRDGSTHANTLAFSRSDIEEIEQALEDVYDEDEYLEFIEIEGSVNISTDMAHQIPSKDNKGKAYLGRSKRYWQSSLSSFWDAAPNVTLPSSGYTSFAQDLSVSHDGNFAGKLNFSVDPGVGPHPISLWVDKVGDISLSPEDFKTAWETYAPSSYSKPTNTVFVIRHADDQTKRYIETLQIPVGDPIPRGKVIWPCMRSILISAASNIVNELLEEIDQQESENEDYCEEDGYRDVECNWSSNAIQHAQDSSWSPTFLCNFELTNKNRKMVIEALKSFYDTNSPYSNEHWTCGDENRKRPASWFNLEGMDRLWMFVPGEGNPNDIYECFGIDYADTWIALDEDSFGDYNDLTEDDVVNRIDVSSQIEDLEEVAKSRQLKLRMSRLNDARTTTTNELHRSARHLANVKQAQQIASNSNDSALMFLEQAPMSAAKQPNPTMSFGFLQDMAFAKSYQLQAELDMSKFDNEMAANQIKFDILQERVTKLTDQNTQFLAEQESLRQKLLEAVRAIESDSDSQSTLSHIFENMGVTIDKVKLSYVSKSGRISTLQEEEILDSDIILDPNIQVWISYLKFSTTEAMELNVFMDNELSTQIMGGPFQYELRSSTRGEVDECRIRPAGKSTILARITNDREQGGYNQVRCHPHAGGTDFQSAYRSSDTYGQIEDLESFYSKWQYICLGEASPALADAAERNSLEDIITIMLAWTKTIQGKDEWGNCYDNFPSAKADERSQNFYVKEYELGFKYVMYKRDEDASKLNIVTGNVPSVDQLINGGSIPVSAERAISFVGSDSSGSMEDMIVKDMARRLRQGYVKATLASTVDSQVNEIASVF